MDSYHIPFIYEGPGPGPGQAGSLTKARGDKRAAQTSLCTRCYTTSCVAMPSAAKQAGESAEVAYAPPLYMLSCVCYGEVCSLVYAWALQTILADACAQYNIQYALYAICTMDCALCTIHNAHYRHTIHSVHYSLLIMRITYTMFTLSTLRTLQKHYVCTMYTLCIRYKSVLHALAPTKHCNDTA